MSSTDQHDAVESPAFPPASIQRCLRMKEVKVYHESSGTTEVAGEIIVIVDPGEIPPVEIGVEDDIGDASVAVGFDSQASSGNDTKEQRAYWLRNTLREGKFGQIRYALALRRRTGSDSADTPDNTSEVEWEVASDIKCAVKQIALEGIRRKRGRLAENPIKEICALQNMASCATQNGELASKEYCAIRHMKESHVITPLDVVMDTKGEFIFTVMPYCRDELLDLLSTRDHFTEAEAREWFQQLLCGLDFLHNTANILHRDLRFENLLLHRESQKLVIVDFCVCLRLPPKQTNKPRRRLVKGGSTNQLNFEAPEQLAGSKIFDGEKLDLFAAGVILFVMVTGFPPWDRSHPSDERFKYMTGGYLAQMVQEWDLNLSPECTDLLQDMLWLEPSDRATLEQVKGHAWMKFSE